MSARFWRLGSAGSEHRPPRWMQHRRHRFRSEGRALASCSGHIKRRPWSGVVGERCRWRAGRAGGDRAEPSSGLRPRPCGAASAGRPAATGARQGDGSRVHVVQRDLPKPLHDEQRQGELHHFRGPQRPRRTWTLSGGRPSARVHRPAIDVRGQGMTRERQLGRPRVHHLARGLP